MDPEAPRRNWIGMQATFDLETARDQIGAEIETQVHPRAA